MRDTEKARSLYLQKLKLENDLRLKLIYDMIKEQPTHSAYSLSKLLGIPYQSIRQHLQKLVKDGLITYESVIVKNRFKKVYKINE